MTPEAPVVEAPLGHQIAMTNPLTDAMEARIAELAAWVLGSSVYTSGFKDALLEALRTAAREAAAAENEACAKVCERIGEPPEGRAAHRIGSAEEWASIKLDDAAEAIRARRPA